MKLNKNIKILLLGANIWYLAEGMLGPMFAIFTERIGGDILDISWAWATYLIVTGVAYIIVGRTLDGKKSKDKVMIVGYALNAVFTFGFLLVSKPWHLAVIQAGLGIAAAMANPTWNALYAKYEDKKHDVLEWGIAGGLSNIITAAAIMIGGMLIKYFSFDVLFLTMGIIQTIAAAIQSLILFKSKTRGKRSS